MTGAAERLKSARTQAGYETATDAANRFGWKPTTYMGHENGSRGFKLDTAQEYARAFKVTSEWLLFGKEPSAVEVRENSADLVPIFNVAASAGHGVVVDHEEIVDSVAFPPGYLGRLTKAHPKNLAIISVKGESMVPTLHDDDIVMIDVTKRDLSFDGLFVLRDNGDGLLVKRIGRASQRGFVMMIPDNKAYPPVERRMDEIDVIGRVIWMGKKV